MKDAYDMPIDGDEAVAQQHKWRQRTLLRIIFPYIGPPLAVVITHAYGLAWYDLVLFFLGVFASGIGFSVGLHRYFTHRCFKTTPALRMTLGILGLIGSHLTIKEYVGVHRCHHAYPDEAGDPHSPYHAAGGGRPGLLQGLLYAHSGWMLDKRLKPNELVRRFAGDYRRDLIVSKLDQHHIQIMLIGLLLPAGLGALLAWHWHGAVSGFVWGGLMRLFVTDQVECWGRGVSHRLGLSPFLARGNSRNHWIAYISMGEWHNNHHAFPNSANHGLCPWQLDLGYQVIVILEKLRLAWDVVRIDETRINSKRIGIAKQGAFYDR